MEDIKNPVAKGSETTAPVATNGQQTDTPVTNKTFREYSDALVNNDIPAVHSAMQTSHEQFKSNHLLRWKKKCILFKADETASFYQMLSDNIGVFAKKDALQIQTRVGKVIDASNTVIPAKLTEAFKSLKDAKDKLKTVRSASEDLLNNLTDSTYSEAVSTLSKAFKDTTPRNSDDNERNLLEAIEGLKRQATHSFNIADDATEVAIKVAGIHASANVGSLKKPSDKVADAMTVLQADIEANIKSASALKVTVQQGYNTMMEQLVETKYVKYADGLRYGGLLETLKQVESPDCKDWSHKTIVVKLDEYANQIENNFAQTVP